MFCGEDLLRVDLFSKCGLAGCSRLAHEAGGAGKAKRSAGSSPGGERRGQRMRKRRREELRTKSLSSSARKGLSWGRT